MLSSVCRSSHHHAAVQREEGPAAPFSLHCQFCGLLLWAFSYLNGCLKEVVVKRDVSELKKDMRINLLRGLAAVFGERGFSFINCC